MPNLMLAFSDGARQPLEGQLSVTLRRDSWSFSATVNGPYAYLNGLAPGTYSVFAFGTAREPAAYGPVRLRERTCHTLHLMLLPRQGGFRFDPSVEIEQSHPDCLASLLNISTVLKQYGFLEQVSAFTDIRRDRVFADAGPALLPAVRRRFARSNTLLHPGAESSYKERRLEFANIQVTFHDRGRIECDLDYYRDEGAHLLLEVLPNTLTGSVTDPRRAYALRWMAMRNGGAGEFAPPYVIA